jgi:2-hydroxy-6-oxonona-2,4-dienedioate hydrolase
MTLNQIGPYTEENTSKTIQALGTTVHYHEMGEGEPIIFLHSYGPGTTAWITWHKVLPAFAQHYRCIAMDLPNFAKTGPVVYEVQGSVHKFQAETALALMDALGIEKAHLVGNSQGGQTAMEFSYMFPDRVNKLVWGAGHINVGVGMYLLGNMFPEEGIRASMVAAEDPTNDNVRKYLEWHLHDKTLITDELVDYIVQMHTGRPDMTEARGKVTRNSDPYPDNMREMEKITAPTLLVWGRDDHVCYVEIGIAALNVTKNSRLVILKDTGHWVPFERPAEYVAHVLPFLQGYERYEPETVVKAMARA